MRMAGMIYIATMSLMVSLYAGEINSEKLIDGYITCMQKAEGTKLTEDKTKEARQELQQSKDNPLLAPYIYKKREMRSRLFVATCQLPELGNVLPLLLAMSDQKLFRLHETGGIHGMPTQRHVNVLDHLKKMGVTSVSFYGVYLE